MKKTNRIFRFSIYCSVILLSILGLSDTVFAKTSYGNLIFNACKNIDPGKFNNANDVCNTCHDPVDFFGKKATDGKKQMDNNNFEFFCPPPVVALPQPVVISPVQPLPQPRNPGDNSNPMLSNIGNQLFQIGRQISVPIMVSDPNVEDKLTISVMGLPNDWDLIQDGNIGEIVGTAQVLGQFSVTVVVEDNSMARDSETFNITVVEAITPEGSVGIGSPVAFAPLTTVYDPERKKLGVSGQVFNQLDAAGIFSFDADVATTRGFGANQNVEFYSMMGGTGQMPFEVSPDSNGFFQLSLSSKVMCNTVLLYMDAAIMVNDPVCADRVFDQPLSEEIGSSIIGNELVNNNAPSGVSDKYFGKVHNDFEDGIPHASDKDNPYVDCASCHGDQLRGGNLPGGVEAPSCFSCHGSVWEDDDDSSDDDNETNIGNRAANFTMPSSVIDRFLGRAHNDSEDGVRHASDKDTPFDDGCTSCHGANLRGGTGPSCLSCHGPVWNEGEDSDGDDEAEAEQRSSQIQSVDQSARRSKKERRQQRRRRRRESRDDDD